MNRPVNENFWALTEKEKQTLRLIVRGHDAKSTARSLGLSVHTINERLRDVRRKMAVTSSREAARLLLAAEGDGPHSSNHDSLGDTEIRGDEACLRVDQGTPSISGAGWASHHPWILTGVILMIFALGLMAITALPQIASTPSSSMASEASVNSEVQNAARQWLTLVDQERWEESYRATGAAFRKLNTSEVWATTSEKVRSPLGAMISRTFLSEEDLPAPPHGYEVVKFRTSFASKADAVETVTLDREDGDWRVEGITIG